jgi:predicted acetyltransferase
MEASHLLWQPGTRGHLHTEQPTNVECLGDVSMESVRIARSNGHRTRHDRAREICFVDDERGRTARRVRETEPAIGFDVLRCTSAAADLGLLREMFIKYRQAWAENCGLPPRAALGLTLPAIRPYVEAHPGAFFMLHGYKHVGFACIDRNVLDSRSEYNIAQLYIEPEFRGSGGVLAVSTLLCALPGKWEACIARANRRSAHFTAQVLAATGASSQGRKRIRICGAGWMLHRFSIGMGG